MTENTKGKMAAYLGNFSFPDGNAAGKRVYGNTSLLSELGYEVTIIDCDEKLNLDGRVVMGYQCYSLPYPQKNIDWLKFNTHFRLVTSILDRTENLELVVIYSNIVISLFNLLLIRYCKDKGIKVVADVVDWLSVQTQSRLYNFAKQADDQFQKSVTNVKCDGVICISEYFQNYYSDRGVPTIVLPTLHKGDENKGSLDFELSQPMVLMYAGKPFRDDMEPGDVSSLKDRVDIILTHLAELKCEGCVFEFHVFGFTENELLAVLPRLEDVVGRLEEQVVFHGQVSNAEILEWYKVASFSVLIRDKKRETIAGFPAKVAESVSHGTPVFVTDVGDVMRYICDRKTGFCAPSEDLEKQKAIMRIALSLTVDEVAEMRNNCINSNTFEVERYVIEARKFLDRL